MKLRKLVIATIGVPALLASFVLAGPAGASPRVIIGGPVSDTVTFAGFVITAGGHFTINSVGCSLTEGSSGPGIPCRLGGAGSLDSKGSPVAGDFAINSAGGPIALHLNNVLGCGEGFGIEVDPPGPVPVTAVVMVTSFKLAPNLFVVNGTVEVHDPGFGVIGCGT